MKEKWIQFRKKRISEYTLGNDEEIERKTKEQIKKEWRILIFIVVGIFLCILAGVLYGTVKQQIRIDRNDPGFGSEETKIQIDIGKEEYEYPLEVEEKQYSKKELKAEMKQGFEYLETHMLQENKSLEKVTRPMEFLWEIQESPLEVKWEFEDETVIDLEGHVYNETLKNGYKETHIKLTLSYGEVSESKVYCIWIYPRQLSDKEKAAEQILTWIRNLEKTSRTKAFFEIPWKRKGGTIRVGSQKNPWYRMTVVLLIAIPLLGLRQWEYEKTQRKIILQGAELEYATILWQFILFLEAGFTIPMAWKKITSDYQRKKDQMEKARCYVYEQMLYAQHQMELGVAQEKAFEFFSEKISLRSYAKLMTLFEQNITKGSKHMLDILKQEEQDAFQGRCEQAKRIGEEADTKLLLPMGMMLMNILLLLMIPAYMQF